ncbi:hypothetical protein RA307_21180 [Xanthobacteraceae bacterium Astr-EGSB]|nr:hypothetical protein [Xanthobacteraceae bacterium Astr-EGSB]
MNGLELALGAREAASEKLYRPGVFGYQAGAVVRSGATLLP